MSDHICYIDSKSARAGEELGRILQSCFSQLGQPAAETVFLCIGSDRITGDCLGPLCGSQLSHYTLENCRIYGTLTTPVHALNLVETAEQIRIRHPDSPVLAIDASLGSSQHLGYITAGLGAISPGAGVRKSLPEIGDIFITGIVNQSGTFEQFMLQTTRLSFIMQMADIITLGILSAFSHPPCREYFYCPADMDNKSSRISTENPAAFSLEASCLLQKP